MKTFNVPQFYNGFCCYFKSTCSSFDKVIKLFTLSCLHPNSTWVRTKFKLVGPWVKPPLEYLIKPFSYYIARFKVYDFTCLLNMKFFQLPFTVSIPKCNNDMPACQIHHMFTPHV